MYRAIPTNNKLCFDKDLKRSWKIHDQKIKKMKSSVSKDKPQHYLFLDQRAKKFALAQFRNTEIAKQNHSLLSKIKDIGEKAKKNSYSKPNTSLCADRSTHKNDYNSCKKKTLNQPYRKRQLNKIVRENQEIMKRIQSKKSMFNVRVWQKQRKNVQKNITLISAYPYKNYPLTQTQVNLWMTDQDINKRSRVLGQPMASSRMKSNALIFSGTQKIGSSYYLIESYLNKKIFNVDIQNLEDPVDKYRMEMSEKQAYQLLEQHFNCDLRKLLHALEIDKKQGICFLKYNEDEDEDKENM